jgi:hypothetical protein
MALSTLEPSRTRAQDSVCPHCGRSVDSPCRPSIVEDGLSVLAGLVLALMLVPPGSHCLEVVLRFPFGQSFAFDLLSSARGLDPKLATVSQCQRFFRKVQNSQRHEFTWMSALPC